MASQAPGNSINNPTGLNIANQTIPKEGPVCVPLGPFNFSTGASYNVNLTTFQQLGRISVVQGMFVDNSGNTSNLVVTCLITGQSVTVAPLTQGYYPLLSVNPFNFVVSSAGAVNFNAVIYVYNVPIPPAVWSAIPNAAGALTVPVSDTLLDSAVSGSKVQTTNYVYGLNDVVHEMHKANKNIAGSITTAATTTLLTGSPSFFVDWVDIAISGNATLSVAGVTTISLVDSNSSEVICQKAIWLPNAALTTTPVFQVFNIHPGMNWNSRGATTNLLLTLSTALATGTLTYSIGAGATAEST
jgi:hypothetical protein